MKDIKRLTPLQMEHEMLKHVTLPTLEGVTLPRIRLIGDGSPFQTLFKRDPGTEPWVNRRVSMSEKELAVLKAKVEDAPNRMPTVKGAMINRRAAAYRPFVLGPLGSRATLPGINSYADACLFCDYLAVAIAGFRDYGFYRYEWANDPESHRFNLPVDVRQAESNRSDTIAQVAARSARLIMIAAGADVEVEPNFGSPEATELCRKVINGEIVIVEAKRGRPATEKAKSAIVNDKKLSKTVEELEKRLRVMEITVQQLSATLNAPVNAVSKTPCHGTYVPEPVNSDLEVTGTLTKGANTGKLGTGVDEKPRPDGGMF